MKRVHQQVKEIRMAQGMTQEELALKAGLVQAAISRFEKGERGVTMNTLIRIAWALGKKIEFTELAEPNLSNPPKGE